MRKVKILSGNLTGHIVDQRDDEAENNVVTGFAEYVTEEQPHPPAPSPLRGEGESVPQPDPNTPGAADAPTQAAGGEGQPSPPTGDPNFGDSDSGPMQDPSPVLMETTDGADATDGADTTDGTDVTDGADGADTTDDPDATDGENGADGADDLDVTEDDPPSPPGEGPGVGPVHVGGGFYRVPGEEKNRRMTKAEAEAWPEQPDDE